MNIIDGISKIIDKTKLSGASLSWAEDISFLSKGQDIDEVLSYFGLIVEDLNPEDTKFFNLIISRTKAVAKAEATTALFDTMKAGGSSASSAALSYLNRFSDGWKVSEKDLGNQVFKFKMINRNDKSE